jgi:hypothetical protein
MESSLAILKLVLDGLDISLNPTETRHAHRSIYLCQVSGLDLNYSFAWYTLGPYSSKLAFDYGRLYRSYGAGDRDPRHLTLKCAEQLQNARNLMQVPPDLAIDSETWVDTLASSHYLMKISRMEWPHIDQVFKSSEKDKLIPYLKDARKFLAAHSLMA